MKKLVVISFSALMLSSCAHNFMRGTVAMKMDKKTAHVCLGNNDVKKGDKVMFYNNRCDRSDGREEGITGLCKMEKIGMGSVTKILNSHYSEIKTEGKFDFSEGTLVQKMK